MTDELNGLVMGDALDIWSPRSLVFSLLSAELMTLRQQSKQSRNIAFEGAD
jgi:hypothetical protein